MVSTTEKKRGVSSARRGLSPATREKAKAILAAKYAFMDTPYFATPDAEEALFGFEREPMLPATSWYQPTRDAVAERDVPSLPQLMGVEEERLMFLRFNYAKRRLIEVQEAVAQSGLTVRRANDAILWHGRFEHFREYLVRTNLALVLAMARRMRLGEMDFAEIVSEGNMALLRAVEKFNVDRGFKFSTYACRAILKALSRTCLKTTRRRGRFPVEYQPDMERSDWQDRRHDAVEESCIDELKAIVNRNLAELSAVEETVIRRRFNWEQESDAPLTLEEVGQVIGVTKERVRQIQNHALAKIRMVMEGRVL